MRLGNSMDFHPFKKGRKFILGGVEIEYKKGLYGVSDADSLLHSIAEAILGALALGDLGKYFKEEDSIGLDSKIILEKCYKMAKDRGYRIINVDSMVLLEKPKLSPYILKMKEVISKILEISIDDVSIKATTMEGYGIIGRGKGCLAQSVVLLDEVENGRD